jgi:GT2 family glycosyltransferase
MTDRNGITASVIVLAYNDRKYLEACLSSLLDQDMPPDDYEVIYADNASTDGSADFVEERFPRVRVLRFDRNLGFAAGNNRAATYARGRYISFQNADTVAHRQWLPELIRAIESSPRVKASHPAGLPLNFGGYNERERPARRGVMCELTRFGYVDFSEVALNSEPVATLFIAGGSLLIDTEVLDQLIYYFDPSYFIYNEDTDLGLRINNLGYQVLFTPKAVCYHQRNASRRSLLNRKGVRMAYLVTRNRFITFYKNMPALAFMLTLPLIFLGSVIKLRTMPLGSIKKIAYGVALIPFTVFALVMAVIRLPQYRAQRRHILSHSPHGQLWLFKQLWKRGVPAHTPLSYGVRVEEDLLQGGGARALSR